MPACPRKCWRANSTVRVVAVVLFLLGVLWFFRDLPAGLRWPVRALFFISAGWLVVTLVRAIRATRFTGRKVAFILILGGFYYLVLSVVCHVFITFMSKRDDRMVMRGSTRLTDATRADLLRAIRGLGITGFDPVIGWTPRPSIQHEIYKTNAQGIRALHEYPLKAADEALRFLCMGDSFTFGVAVGNDESYPAQAEKLMPGSEWLNFGVPGGCLTQAYLRYREQAAKFGGATVVVGFMTNDAQRTVNAFRPFLNSDSGCPMPKPFAKLTRGKFSIEPNPCRTLEDLRRIHDHELEELPKLLALDYLTWSGRQERGGSIGRAFTFIYTTREIDRNLDAIVDYRWQAGAAIRSWLPRDPYGDDIWEKDSPGFQAVCAMFETFSKQVAADGRKVLFVIIPGPQDVFDFSKRRPRVYENLIAHLQSAGVPHLDFLDPLVALHPDDLKDEAALFVGKHYKPEVTKELAREIMKKVGLPVAPVAR